jgi:hypothetical protein
MSIYYTLAVIGAGLIVCFGVPLMQRLLRAIKPLTPKQEEAEHFREEARRRIDKMWC